MAGQLTIPFIHHLFHRPAPVYLGRTAEGLHRWRCSCGEVWDE